MEVIPFLRSALHGCAWLLYETPDAWITTIVFWFARVVLFLLMLRTFIIPSFVAFFSKHIRVRSISFRSIRGLYIRQGHRTWHINRIAISRPKQPEGPRRISVMIEGLKLELDEDQTVGNSQDSEEVHRHHSSLRRFGHSLIAFRLWYLASSLYDLISPFLRPVIRNVFVSLLRQVIQRLPSLTKALTFEVHSAELTFASTPGTRILITEAKLHAALKFIHQEHLPVPEEPEANPVDTPRVAMSFSMADWQARFMRSSRRTWDRAWGRTQGFATVSLILQDVSGFTSADGNSKIFMRLPGAMNLDASMRFNPKRGTISRHGLETMLLMDTVFLALDPIQSMLKSMKAQSTKPRTKTAVPRTPGSASQVSSGIMPSNLRPHRKQRQSLKPRTIRSSRSSGLSLSFLTSASVHVASLELVSNLRDENCSITDSYESKARNLILTAKLSHPSHTWLHRECLGKSLDHGDGLDPDSYAFDLSLDGITVEHSEAGLTHSRIPFLTLGRVEIEVLLSQWPFPWLATSQFFSGDPNAPLAALRAHFTSLEIKGRLRALQRLFPSGTREPREISNHKGPVPMPRIMLALQCGKFCGSLLCDDAPTLEICTDGVFTKIASEFLSSEQNLAHIKPLHLSSDLLPLKMSLKAFALLKPTFIKASKNSNYLAATQGSSTTVSLATDSFGDSLLSLEAFEARVEGGAIGTFHDDGESPVLVDGSSMTVEVHCVSEAFSLELWHPNVITALRKVASQFSDRPSAQQSVSKSPSLLDRLPFGVSATIVIPRFVLFVTSPDVNPKDDLQISRGFAFRTGFWIHYCALRPIHTKHFRKSLPRLQVRHKLGLPEERMAKAFTQPRNLFAFLHASFWNTSLRSCTATQYVADDPHIAERDDPAFKSEDWLRLREGRIEVNLSRRHQDATNAAMHDICQIHFHLLYIWANFKLSHAYNLLLGLETLKIFSVKREQQDLTASHTVSVLVQFQGNIKAAEIVLQLPKQSAIIRMDAITSHYVKGKPIQIRWNTLRLWVSISRLTTGDLRQDERWQELLRFHQWDISLHRSEGVHNIVIQGDSARLHIPSNYVIADLILDVTVSFKCLRHLARIARSGEFVDIPTPGSESARMMPSISLCLRCLSAEASDDDLESRLALIWRVGLEASKQRIDREEAFRAKVATIQATGFRTGLDSDYQFDDAHTVSLEEARERLFRVHALDWSIRHKNLKQQRMNVEKANLQDIYGDMPRHRAGSIPNIVNVSPIDARPPLFRIVLHGLSLRASPPSFSLDNLPDFLHDQGKGLPRDTKFSLLLPLHLWFTTTSLRATLRDYPLPLLNVPSIRGKEGPAVEFDSDLVIAEELGTAKSVAWVECRIIEPIIGMPGVPLTLMVPKTAMPVKTYANPIIRFLTDGVTAFSWGVSYSPATQDVMRFVDTLTVPSVDLSPVMGFWDKIRLIFHWKIRASFDGDVRLNMKGARDPYQLHGDGAGFVFCWRGHPELFIGYPNEDNELIQITSDSMLAAIPEFEVRETDSIENALKFKKICVKLASGVRFGVGFVPERACGQECNSCSGAPFFRDHRIFHFVPHYEVQIDATKASTPLAHSADDSYNGFRSDFVHLSISLNSSIRNPDPTTPSPNSLYLTPKTFAHFWSWWALFDDTLFLRIRQGSYYPPRHPSPKFGRHLATIKYRISVPDLFVSHVYIDDSRETWVEGITPFVGLKAVVKHFEADMHQRLSEIVLPGHHPESIKLSRHKPFYAAEVSLKDLDLRALVATFDERLKKSTHVSSPPRQNIYRTWKELPTTDSQSSWFDPDDFVEIERSPSTKIDFRILPVAACPHFAYFKRSTSTAVDCLVTSKFGSENTHTCFLGKNATAVQIQLELANARILELKSIQSMIHDLSGDSNRVNLSHYGSLGLEKKVKLLHDYINQLKQSDADPNTVKSRSYHLPSDMVCEEEWSEFDNVYQIHSPKVFMDSAIRDIMLHYYHCSRARRGFEYHMAQRAVKFIRDQAKTTIGTYTEHHERRRYTTNPALAAATALRKIFTGDIGQKSSGTTDSTSTDLSDPLCGWSEGVSLRRNHFCLLLKPQIVLRSESDADSTCILAAVQAKLESFKIVDNLNAEDPACGKIMTRNYTSLTSLQAFAPANICLATDGCVPLEVLIDFRCESEDFDRLVPPTDATFHYDRFNRLRLRNIANSAVRKGSEQASSMNFKRLHDQTDLIEVHVPRFTVTATDSHFKIISDIVTKLILFSDAAQKLRLDKLETLLFTYDFTDLASAAGIVSDLQRRLRDALEAEQRAESEYRVTGSPSKVEIFKLKAHISLLAEELSLLFDAIRLAQERLDDQNDQKSALLLQATSDEISWRMLDERNDLLAKLAVRNIDFSWLSRQDSSTVTNLTVGDLQAFDGSPNAVWTEILSKHSEPANHFLFKRGIFVLANWAVLAPVGGITVYEHFELNLHPMRLQMDAKVGSRILEYFWPARKRRKEIPESLHQTFGRRQAAVGLSSSRPLPKSRMSLDSPPLQRTSQLNSDPAQLAPPFRRIGLSRSSTDLRSSFLGHPEIVPLQRIHSSDHNQSNTAATEGAIVALKRNDTQRLSSNQGTRKEGTRSDAAEMKTRSSQKTFVLARISSLHILLSVMKEQSFECRDAHIRTRELVYRNQTWSFEELVNQFIPSNMSWRGWVKMVFHQPLIPVLPVARELLSKTKLIASKGSSRVGEARRRSSSSNATRSHSTASGSPSRQTPKRSGSSRTTFTESPSSTGDEPEDSDHQGDTVRPNRRKRMLRMLRVARRSPRSTRSFHEDNAHHDHGYSSQST